MSNINILWQKLRLNFLGLVFALAFLCLSLTPSLMPRPWLYQGVIGGISIAVGYAVGVLVSKFIRWLFESEPSLEAKRNGWRVLAVLWLVIAVLFLSLSASWQDEVRELLDMPKAGGWVMIFAAMLAVFVSGLLLLIGRSLTKLTRFIDDLTSGFLPRKVSAVIGVLAVSLLVLFIINGVIFKLFVDISNNIYRSDNNKTAAGVEKPTARERSGSDESLVSWESLGYEGRSFTGLGPTKQKLQEFNGAPALEPIRVYVGVESKDTAESRAQLALEELERTGAFEREILVIANTTGTGWLEPQSMDSLEYMYNGNSAIVTIQYSYLPSWISFLVDKDNALDAGQALYNAIQGKWATLPKDSRPKLIAYGLSLGSFSGQAAFSGANDVRFNTDGALFLGTPNDTRLWSTITKNREPGSLEILPVYNNGKTVRFAANQQDIEQNSDIWQKPRLLYLQHPSDPVVWFSFDLLLHEPDWLKEPRGSDVSPYMNWFPIVTFLQVAVDQFFGVKVPVGHGHNYPNIIVQAWESVTTPAGWTDQKSARLQELINTYQID